MLKNRDINKPWKIRLLFCGNSATLITVVNVRV